MLDVYYDFESRVFCDTRAILQEASLLGAQSRLNAMFKACIALASLLGAILAGCLSFQAEGRVSRTRRQ